MSEKIEKKQLIMVDASRIYCGPLMHVDGDAEIWCYYARRHTSRVPAVMDECVVCGRGISPGENWYEKVGSSKDVLHSGCAEILLPGEVLYVWNNAGKSAEDMTLEAEAPAPELTEDVSDDQDITWFHRPLILIKQHEQNQPSKFAVDMYGRKWQHVPFDRHFRNSSDTCEICGKVLVDNAGVWIKRIGNYLNQICELCVVPVERAEILDAYLEKHHIPKRCQDFETCSQHCEVVQDYHWHSGDLVYKDYRCLVCDRTWYATYRGEMEIDSETEEVYIDHT